MQDHRRGSVASADTPSRRHGSPGVFTLFFSLRTRSREEGKTSPVEAPASLHLLPQAFLYRRLPRDYLLEQEAHHSADRGKTTATHIKRANPRTCSLAQRLFVVRRGGAGSCSKQVPGRRDVQRLYEQHLPGQHRHSEVRALYRQRVDETMCEQGIHEKKLFKIPWIAAPYYLS